MRSRAPPSRATLRCACVAILALPLSDAPRGGARDPGAPMPGSERCAVSDGSPGSGGGSASSGRLAPPANGDLAELLSAAVQGDGIGPDAEDLRAEIETFYRARGWTAAWFGDVGPTAQARAVAALLADGARKALDPADYDGPAWTARLQRVARADLGELARADVALTAATARYALHLRRGRVDPRRVDFEIPPDPTAPPLSQILAEVSAASDVSAAIHALEPPYAPYRRTLRALEVYEQLASRPSPPPLSEPRRPVSRGQRYPGAPALAARLAAVGDLPASMSTVPASEPALGEESASAGTSDIYDAALADAVARFQRRHGMQASGELDAATVRELNVPVERRAAQLRLAVERWRWLPRSFGTPPIVVNIPEFRLHAADAEHPLSLRVVVGRSLGSRTPVFASEITSIIFRPPWNVPLSIARDELAPKVTRDPSILERDGYEVVGPRGRLDVGERGLEQVLKDVRAGRARLRQKPGAGNALGLVKFAMPNAHDVYLHGTPASSLFRAPRRDFSHGCIRVDRPEALAAWLLRDQPDWSQARIRAAMNARATSVVPLARAVPVLVLYATATVREDGAVQFMPDIYGHDARLERELANRRTVVRTALR